MSNLSLDFSLEELQLLKRALRSYVSCCSAFDREVEPIAFKVLNDLTFEISFNQLVNHD